MVSFVKIHLIGVCGTGMGSLAGLLKAAGHEVRGSDQDVYPPMSLQLRDQGIPVLSPFAPTNLEWGPDCVVVGNVCRKDHVEVVAAQVRGIRLTSFPALLSELFLRDAHSVVIAGTHGKTTASSLMATVLTHAGQDPSFLIGGVPLEFGRGWRHGRGGPFVVEGDEYDTAFFDKRSKFLHYRPRTVILTSVELDHLDIFSSLESIKAAFREFVALIPPDGTLIVSARSPAALEVAQAARCRIETYGMVPPEGGEALSNEPTWSARRVAAKPWGRSRFELRRHGETLGELDVGLLGQHNLENSTAVAAAAVALGVGFDQLRVGLRRFAGVKRRQELRGVAQGVTVIDDFAHHPTAVRETILAVRPRTRGRLVALYEPRSASSRRAVFQREYVDALALANEVFIAPVHHAAQLADEERFDPERLAHDLRGRGISARAATSVEEIVEAVACGAAPGDLVLAMSSGSFDGIHGRLLDRLGDAVVPARDEDRTAIGELLDQVGLPRPESEGPVPGFSPSPPSAAPWVEDFLVLRGGGERGGASPPHPAVRGCVALRLFDESSLLHSLAIVPHRRGEGLGWLLADNVLARARARGAVRVYLLTDNARDFFAEKLGFRPVEREAVEASVRSSAEFLSPRWERATCMRLDLQ
jgi:UDP-N-acetylmuramate: L-alanyl-gamma-D-glutamyl-meso-diaminopimelate ligase